MVLRSTTSRVTSTGSLPATIISTTRHGECPPCCNLASFRRPSVKRRDGTGLCCRLSLQRFHRNCGTLNGCASPINKPFFLWGFFASAPLAGHHHIRIVVPTTGTHQSFTAIGNGRLPTLSLRHFGGIGLNLMLTIPTPYDKAKLGSRGIPERHRWTGMGFHRLRRRKAASATIDRDGDTPLACERGFRSRMSLKNSAPSGEPIDPRFQIPRGRLGHLSRHSRKRQVPPF
jgi:hypothetical protein